MRTAGQLLKEERLKKGFTVAQVEKVTKIRAKFIEAIETDDYKRMPALPYVQGFLRNYSDFLGLRSTTILAIFRRQYTLKDKHTKEIIEEPLTQSRVLTRNKVILALVLLMIISLFGYFFWQYRQLHEPPPLLIEQPKNELVVDVAEISIFGKTDPDATVMVNNEPVLIKEDGKFFVDVPLSIGNNTVVVEATSRIGEKTTLTRKITRTP